MSLKSLVNKSIIKSDLRRYWYLGALFTVMLLLTAVLPAAYCVKTLSYINSNGDFIEVFASDVFVSIFAVLAFGIVTPAMIFSYIHHKSAVHMVHSLPIKRESLYFSHLVSAGILNAAPVIINMFIMLGIKGLHPSNAFIWAGLTLVYVFLITSFGTAAATLTANVFASIVLPYIVILLPMFIEMMARLLCERYLYGFTGNGYVSLTSHIYADYEMLLKGMIFVYIVLGILFFAIGLVSYKKRALENNSRLAAFNVLNPIFLYGVAVCAGFLGYAYVTEFTGNDGTMWLAAPFGIAGLIIARMIIERTFRPRNIIKPAVIYLAILCAVYVFVGLDITGYEKRVPNIDDITSVDVCNYGYNQRYYTAANAAGYADISVRLAPEAIHDAKLYKPEDIEKVIALHRGIINDKGNKDLSNFCDIPVTYTLKNGRTLKRRYSFDKSGELETLYESVMNTTPVKADRFPVLSDIVQEYTSAQVSTCGINRTNLTNEQMNAVIQALKEDIAAADYKSFNGDALTTITVNVIMPSIDDAGNPITDKSGWASEQLGYAVHMSYKKTIALLKEWGMYNVMPSAETISSVQLRKQNEYGEEYNSKYITDKENIQKLLNYIQDNQDELRIDGKMLREDGTDVVFNYDGGNAWVVSLLKVPEL